MEKSVIPIIETVEEKYYKSQLCIEKIGDNKIGIKLKRYIGGKRETIKISFYREEARRLQKVLWSIIGEKRTPIDINMVNLC